jgi:hypothetical protein
VRTSLKRIYRLLFFLILLLALAIPNPAASQTETVATVRFSPPSVALAPGEGATIEVWVDDAVDLRAFEIEIQFDPGLLIVSNLVLGDFIDPGIQSPSTTIDNDAGILAYGIAHIGQPDEPNHGTGWLFSFDIEAKTNPGESPLNLTKVELVFTDDYFLQDYTAQNGLVRVCGVIDDHYSLDAGETLLEPAPGVLSNDILPEGAITAELVTESHDLPEGLVWADTNDGSFTYTPPADFSGTASFSYRVCTDAGTCYGPATVSLEVNPKESDEMQVFLPLFSQ